MVVESNRIEFKRKLNERLEKEVVAFLNYSVGGIIYVGIDDKSGKPVAIKDIDKTQLQIKDRIKNNISPSALGLFDVIVETKDDIEIIKIIIAAGNERPYYIRQFGMSEKGCFVRVGSASEPMSTRMIEELYTKRTRISIGKIESRQQTLTFEQLKIYYQEKRHKLNDQFASNLELLTKSQKYNYVAYLLADKNGNSIKVAKYSEKNRVDLIENNEYGYCSLIKATKQVLDKLEVENKTFTKITSKQRIENFLIDPIALREAVINAIVHNDYTDEIPPKFEFFSDRLEITSKGGLPLGFSVEEFFSGYSHPRNKELMRVFKDLELVEYLGSGIPRILEKYTKKAFIISDNYLRIIFPFEKGQYFSVKQNTTQETENTTQETQNTTQETQNTTQETENTTQEILKLIEKKPNITRNELAKNIGITPDGIKYHLMK